MTSWANMIDEIEISGKKIFIFETHSAAIIPWAWVSSTVATTPFLISLDYHTDTHQAFLWHSHTVHGEDWESRCRLHTLLCSKIDKANTESLYEAFSKLRHDEHIDAAIQAGILSHSFSIQYSDPSGTLSNEQDAYINIPFEQKFMEKTRYPEPPYTYSIPDRRMFVVPRGCAVNCQRNPHNDQCVIDVSNQAIESVYLNEKINTIRAMSETSGLGGITNRPYILDIDLDYFRTARSVIPHDATTLYDLIRGATAITIAKETTCVENLRLEGESITSEYLLNAILQHVTTAINQQPRT